MMVFGGLLGQARRERGEEQGQHQAQRPDEDDCTTPAVMACRMGNGRTTAGGCAISHAGPE